jgi:AraC-like DNA-binding protein
MAFARPLDRFTLIRTSSLDEMRAALARIYANPVMEIVGRDRTLQATINHHQLQHVGLSYGSYAANIRMRFPETDFVSQIFPIRGKGEALVNGTSTPIDPDCGVVISANESLNLANNAEYERLILRMNSAALTNKLAAISGASINGPIKFNPIQAWAQPAAKALRDHFLFLIDSVSTAAVPLPKLILAEFEQALMGLFLYANQNNYSYLLQQKPPDAAPSQVRTAEEYIEANWDKPVSLEAVAAETGVSILSLFRKFRQARGYSPAEFLRQVRLRHARERLQRPDTDTTVTQVASVCGFGDLDRFSKAYFQAFGEQPSETLNRSKGADFAWH